MTGVRVRTDRLTFETWAEALSGLALPAEFTLSGAEGFFGEWPTGPGGRGGPGGPGGSDSIPVPPLVAASLALHGCAEVAIVLRLSLPEGETFGCFGLAADLAAGLVRSGQDVEIGLFGSGELVEEVVRHVPGSPPPPVAAATGCVRIAVLGADAAIAGWQQILVSGENQWRRMQCGSDPGHLIRVQDVHEELAADLRDALASFLVRDHRD